MLIVGEILVNLKEFVDEKRKVFIECVFEVDEELGDLFLMGEELMME